MSIIQIKIRKIDEQPPQYYVQVITESGREHYQTPRVSIRGLELEDADDVVMTTDDSDVAMDIEDDSIQIDIE